ncbi:hypothetical protein CUJ83_12780 [Methanocella sp. CWC-04]|uniref:Cyclophilin TM1367-like domain-containing protein n=1 Tax=Methanooceanicella nereidis TaxID=2052831 RepID=A0AAP2W8A7_9EURY|nr:cyclophilin-like fold protein [Methanocella sp. CWC-04]MCD1295871.1 hypothetical protein [Methanocella sp. CWC-04]
MATPVRIIINDLMLEAELFDTACGNQIAIKLPLEVIPRKWGDEFYFEVPVNMPLDETATMDVNIGDIGYWPPGMAMAIFFGPTPMSKGEKPVPASEVNIVGKVIGDATILKNVKGVKKIRIEMA